MEEEEGESGARSLGRPTKRYHPRRYNLKAKITEDLKITKFGRAKKKNAKEHTDFCSSKNDSTKRNETVTRGYGEEKIVRRRRS